MHWQACVAASGPVGLGHLVRVLALQARAGLDMRHLWIWTDWPAERLRPLVHPLPFTAVPPGTDAWPGGAQPNALLVDMPDPPRRLLDQTRPVPRRLLLGCSDDRTGWASLTVNVAEGGALDQPEPAAHERLWQGARFAALRSEFTHGRQIPHDPSGPVLVAIGGTDAARLSLPLVHALLAAPEHAASSIEVLIGPDHPDRAALGAVALADDRLSVIPPDPRLAQRLQRASAAVVAPGNLLLECLALQTPALAIAQNTRQGRDFRAYPWLFPAERMGQLPAALATLLGADLKTWQTYAERTQTGQSLARLSAWCQAPQTAAH